MYLLSIKWKELCTLQRIIILGVKKKLQKRSLSCNYTSDAADTHASSGTQPPEDLQLSFFLSMNPEPLTKTKLTRQGNCQQAMISMLNFKR